jgi:hypothetical protein
MMAYDKLDESERVWLQGKRNAALRSQIRTLAAAAILPVLMFLVWRDRRRVVIAVARTLPDDLRQLMEEGRLSLAEAQTITRIRAERQRRRFPAPRRNFLVWLNSRVR